MRIIDIDDATAHLSRLVEQAARGQAFIIAKAGKPMVKVTAVDTQAVAEARRLGFLTGEIKVPDDFDRMGASTIGALFCGEA